MNTQNPLSVVGRKNVNREYKDDMMEIEKLLKLEKRLTEKEFIEMILSNRIDYYAGDEIGAAITVKNFGILAEDIIKWYNNKKGFNNEQRNV